MPRFPNCVRLPVAFRDDIAEGNERSGPAYDLSPLWGLYIGGISPTGVDTPAYTLTPYGLIMPLGDRFPLPTG